MDGYRATVAGTVPYTTYLARLSVRRTFHRAYLAHRQHIKTQTHINSLASHQHLHTTYPSETQLNSKYSRIITEMGKDYYQILGVSKSASDDELKRAYKKLALKHHPDRNKDNANAKVKFQEIGEAFEVLSDKNKRAVYDQFGEEGLKGGGAPSPGAGGPGMGAGAFPGAGFGGPGGATFTFTSGGPGGFKPSDPNDIFASLFGGLGGGAFGGMGGGMDDDDFSHMGGNGGGRRRGGGGGMPGGFQSFFGGGGMQGGMGGGMPSMPQEDEATKDSEKQLPCSLEDLYNGVTKKLKVGKRLMNGQTEEKVLQIDVKRGWKKGTKVRFSGAGNEVAPGRSQDLVFIITEKLHPRFTRENDDLHIKLPLPIVDALDPPKPSSAGSKHNVKTLDYRTIDVPLPQPGPGPGKTTVQAGRTTRIANEGMPISKTDGKRKGDLVVQWELQMPDKLSDAQRAAIRQALS
ncbi:DnaJ-domain-containing protein [Tilletiaria anomala UBC 951]|uniref:DnaJ-domain-containing protein n=1 Tax=Tilletiaria anomala (strain ATCC 24038 / CBS 436.72 / UBC 951) TaxID=1037660 RepID=A0A066VSK2_TILAU|nr:DnaJ-domain-containing protein [Tilletiaria anomala UBC 951]KDN41779.1 DnaJ-domain-containing protein [Tilletiaria anomala UBC 951]